MIGLRQVQQSAQQRTTGGKWSSLLAGNKCWAIGLKQILGVDLQGAGTDRRTFDMCVHAKDGALLAELSQLDAKDLPSFQAYMVRKRRNERMSSAACALL